MTGRAGRLALVKVTGAPVAFAAEASTTTDHQAYVITNAAKRLLDRDTAVVVDVGGVLTLEAYTVNRLTGTITFAAVDLARGAVTVSGAYLPSAVAVGVRGYSFALSTTLVDDTDFDSAYTDDGFTRKLTGMYDVQGSLTAKWRSDTTLRDALLNATFVVLEFYSLRSAAPDLVCWAVLEKDALTIAVDGGVDKAVDWKGTADADGNAAAVLNVAA